MKIKTLLSLALTVALFGLPVMGQAQELLPQIDAGHFQPFANDAMKVVLLGSGGPMSSPDRVAQSIAIMVDNEVLVFDAGPGSSRNMDLLRVPAGRLTHMFFTHYHSDHIADFAEMRLSSWIGGRKAPLEVHGPIGLVNLVNGINQAYQQDIQARMAHHGPELLAPSAEPVAINEFALPAPGSLQKVYEKGDLRVFAFTVNHAPIEVAVGYRIEYGSKAIVISGDTMAIPELVVAARNADILFADGLGKLVLQQMAGMAQAAGLNAQAKLLQDIQSYHMSPAEAAHVAANAQVQNLVFVHVTPPLNTPQIEMAYTMGVSDAFSGPAYIGKDGMFFVLNK